MCDKTKEVKGIGFGRMLCENLAVDRLGLIELAGAVELDGLFEGLLKSPIGHGNGVW